MQGRPPSPKFGNLFNKQHEKTQKFNKGNIIKNNKQKMW